ncbi:Ig-like domain-containing protein [Compostibacter hankyongensis]|uniref:Cadherin domain-containing protein n=1 Tax=Compostibacter hankyongensis TaxID=1007089 RepID=A0ABP8FKF0_9BACT
MTRFYTKRLHLLLLIAGGLFTSFRSLAQYTPAVISTGGTYTAVATDRQDRAYVVAYNAGSDKYEVDLYPAGSTGGHSAIYSDLANPGVDFPWGIAVNSHGDIYVTNPNTSDNWEVIKLEGGTRTPSVILKGNYYTALTTDANDNLLTMEYDSSTHNYQVVRYDANGGARTILFNGLPLAAGSGTYPWGIVTDKQHNIYILDFPYNASNGRVIKLAAPGYNTPTTLLSGKNYSSLAIDAVGNLYTSEFAGGSTYHVMKYAAPALTSGMEIYTGLSIAPFLYPWGLAVDGHGNVFVNDPAANAGTGKFIKLTSDPIAVTSVTRASPNPTAAPTVDFTVKFSAPVSNVTASAFSITTTGSIRRPYTTNVTGSGTTYTVTVNTGTGTGTLQLGVNGIGVMNNLSNIPYTDGEVYTIYDATEAYPDTIQVTENIPATGNVLTNDQPADGTSLTASLVTAPVNGTVVLNADGSFTYTPNMNYSGADSLIYQACDNGMPSRCDTATVLFQVKNVNGAPEAYPDTLQVDEDVPATGNVLTNDHDPEGNQLTASLVTAPVNGTVVLNADGSFTYTPNANYSGSDSLIYQVCDNGTPSLCDTATVLFQVKDVNDAPEAYPDIIQVTKDIPATGNVLTNDQDAEGNALTASLVTAPVNGTVVLNADGSFTYTPNANYVGSDSLVYQVCDNGTPSRCDTATVLFHITDMNSPVITSVDVPADGYYHAGDVLDFTVHCSENVIITGTPSLAVTIGTATVQASYTGGSGTNALTFSYTVQPGEMDMDGIALGSSLNLNGGTFRDIAGNNGNLALSGVPNTRGIFVNTALPSVTLSTNAPALVNTQFTVTITFSEAVTGFTLGDLAATNAGLSNLQTADNITYTVEVVPLADGPVTLQVPADVAVNIGNNGNTGSNTLNLGYDGTRPEIRAVSLPATGTYKAGDVLNFTAKYSENVTASGMPYLEVVIGSDTVHAAYTAGTGTDALSFQYTVAPGDEDDDGVRLGASLQTNGGSIRDAAGNNAGTELKNIATNTVLVDAVAPVVTAVDVPADGYYKTGDTLGFTVRLSEKIRIDTAGGNPFLELVIGTRHVRAPLSGSGTATLVFSYIVQEGDEDLDGIALTNDLALNGGTLVDAAGNDLVPVLSHVGSTRNVFVYSKRPAVRLSGTPSSDKPFTLTVTFSEAVTGFTLGDLTTTNADLSNLQTTNNTIYTLQVTPQGDGTITLQVPAGAAANIAGTGNTASNVISFTHDGTAPVVTSVDVPADKTYKAGEVLSFTVHFSEDIAVTGSDATLRLIVGAAAKQAGYVSADANSMVFSYTVQAGDLDTDGITVNDLSLNNASVRDTVGNNADPALHHIGATNDVKVDAVAPVIATGQVFTVEENSAPGASVGTVNATDPGSVNTLQGWTITGGNTDSAFAINAAAGEITVADSSKLDYETKPSYTLTLTVSDGVNTSTPETVTIRLKDVNDHAPVIAPGQRFDINENSADSAIVGAVKATDIDAGTTFSNWTITGGNAGNAFAIDKASGKITVADSSKLDYETTPSYTLTLTVSDGTHTSKPATVTIQLEDVPEAPTAIRFSSADLYENRPSGTLAGVLSSVSANPQDVFTYTLVRGEGGGDNHLFGIRNDSLLTTSSLDYEQKSSYKIRVRTTTRHGDFFEQALTIRLLDVNEAPTLTVPADLAICYTTDEQQITLGSITAGEDKDQTTAVSVAADKADFFDMIFVSGNKLHYKLRKDVAGQALITLTVKDNGGTDHGGVDEVSDSFTLTVNPVPEATITSDMGTDISKGRVVHLTATGGNTYAWSPADGILDGAGTAVLTVRPEEPTTYAVTVTDANGCSARQEINLQVKADYQALEAPNILTPNGDGRNDTWNVRNLDVYPDNEVFIYDRSGRLVFHQKNYQNRWDGTLNGKPLQTGTYYYIVNVDAGKKVFRGYITIIRNNP